MRKLSPYILKYKWFILATIIFTAIKVISDLLLPTIMANIIDIGIINNDLNYIIKAGIYMILITIVGGIFSIASRYYASKISVNVGKDLRNKIFNKICSLSFHEIDEFGASSLITRTTNDISQIENVLGMGFRLAFLAPLILITTLIIALSKDASLTKIILIATFILAGLMGSVLYFSIPLFKKKQKLIDKLNLVVRERLTGVRVIRAFDKTDFEKEKFDNSSKELMKLITKVTRLMATLSPFVQFMFSIVSIALVWFGAFRIDSGNLQVGELIAFLQYGSQLMFSIMMLVIVFVFIPRAQISIDRIMEVIDIKNEIKNDGSIEDNNKEGTISFKNVSFFYHSNLEAEEAAVKNLNFTLKSGDYNAIIGSTGSGKSTIIKLIERFYDVSSGEILIDNVNIKDYTNKTLKELISISPQKTTILTDSVKNNVDINNKLTEEEVIRALKTADAYEFVSKFDDGINHELNRAGTNLSGGQKQRISIARTVAKKSPIYIFDDSFSALDFKTEENIKKHLFEHLRDKTIIVVAQKISSIKNADKILVMDNGLLVDAGKHEQLKQRCKVYREIIASQEEGENYEA